MNYFTDSDKKEVGIDTTQAIAIMLEKFEIVKQMFYGYDYIPKLQGSNQDRIKAITEGINHIFGQEDSIQKELGAIREILREIEKSNITVSKQSYNKP